MVGLFVKYIPSYFGFFGYPKIVEVGQARKYVGLSDRLKITAQIRGLGIKKVVVEFVFLEDLENECFFIETQVRYLPAGRMVFDKDRVDYPNRWSSPWWFYAAENTSMLINDLYFQLVKEGIIK